MEAADWSGAAAVAGSSAPRWKRLGEAFILLRFSWLIAAFAMWWSSKHESFIKNTAQRVVAPSASRAAQRVRQIYPVSTRPLAPL